MVKKIGKGRNEKQKVGNMYGVEVKIKFLGMEYKEIYDDKLGELVVF